MKTRLKKIFCVLLCIIVVFSFGGCGKFDTDLVKHSKKLSCYEIDAVVNDDAKSVTATMKLDYVNLTESVMTELRFNLFGTAFSEDAQIKPCSNLNETKCYPNGINFGDMKILRVVLNEKEVQYFIAGVDNNVLVVPLDIEIYPDAKITIVIDFLLLLSNNTHRLGWCGNNINLGNWFPILCVYEDGAFVECPYYFVGDPFYSDMANFEVKITYPNNYVIVGSGDKIRSDSNGEVNIDVYEAKCVRDFAFCLSKDFVVRTEILENTTVNYFAYAQDNAEDVEGFLDVSILAFQTFSKLYGNYPYKTLNVVKTSFMHGGMEYPNMVFISDSIADDDYYNTVIVHEIAHQWWYGVVGNNEVADAWIDEAMAEYSTILFYEENPSFDKNPAELIAQNVESYTLYCDVIASINGQLNTQMNLAVNQYANEYEYVYMVYVKGVLMLNELSNTMGKQDFLKALKLCYKVNKFKNIKADDFIACFESVANTDLSGFFDSWLNGKVSIIKTN